MIPPEFHGVWQRASISLDGGPAVEPQHVIWVQAEAAFADLRVPHVTREDDRERDQLVDEPSAFAGTTVWEPPCLVWHHELDRGPLASPHPADEDTHGGGGDSGDRGEVTWQGGDLVETGVLERGDRALPYVEVWRRLTRPGEAALALATTDGGGRIVQVGDHAITLVDDRPTGSELRTAYRVRRAGGVPDRNGEGTWVTVLTLGHEAELLPVPPTTMLETDLVTIDGQPWHVLEAPAALG